MRAAHRVSLRGDGVRRIVTRADNRRESCVEVLKTIASIPGEILSIKVKEAEGEKGIAAAEASLIGTQLKLLKDQMALEALRTVVPVADPAK